LGPSRPTDRSAANPREQQCDEPPASPSRGSPTSAPVDAFGLSGGTADVSLGMNHGCALSTAGGLRCWGVGTDGQLGSGSPTNSATPVEVLSLSAGVRSVAGGLAHTCAVTAAGRVKCWGRGSSGQLGNGSLTSSANPVDVSWLPGA
jgi:alpha-tubulin suppressor-like RCC1 family protein